MADEQLLGEFIQHILEDLQSGAITTEQAIVASSQYEYVRTLFSQNADQLAEATALNDEALKTTLISIFNQTKSRLSELPAFSSQTPDVVRKEKQTKEAAVLEHFAFETLRKETKAKMASRKLSRKDFIHTLVTKYSTRTNSVIAEDKMNAVVDSALSNASHEQSSQEAQQKFVKELTHGLGISDPAFEKILTSTIVEDATKTIVGSWKDAQVEKQALVTLFTHPDLARPDVVIDAFLHTKDSSLLSDVSTHAVKLAQTAEALHSLGMKIPLVKSGPFFSASNSKGFLKGAQNAADGILSLVGEPFREMLVKEKIGEALKTLLSNANQLADVLGEKFIHTTLFTQIAQNILKGSNEKPSSSQAGNIVGDVIGAVLRGPIDSSVAHGTRKGLFGGFFGGILNGPLDPAVTQAAKNNLFDFFELARANAAAPSGFSFLTPIIMPWHLGAARKEFEQSKISPAPFSRGWLPSLGLYKLGSVAGDALANIFNRFVDVTFAGPVISRQLHASRRAAAVPTPLSEDLPLLLSLVVIATIVILFVLPTPLNIPHLSTMQKLGSLLASLSKGESTSTNNNGWPVSCGCISQGPGEGTHSANGLNAIDFLFGTCSPAEHVSLYATGDGKVVNISQQYSVGEKCDDLGGGHWDCHGKSTYGNYVDIELLDGQVVRYGHMASILVSDGQAVTKGQQLGTSNHNGVTTVEHLHFEVLGGMHAHPLLSEANKVIPEPGKNGLCVGVQ